MTEILAIAGGLAVLAGGSAVVVQIVNFLKKMSNVVDDWAGEPAREGVPARAGVMKRLEQIEAELRTNHGSSLRDAINRIEANQYDLSTRFDAHVKQSIEGRIPGLIDESN